MSQHQAFRRAAVQQQIAQKLETTTIPAPTRGIVQSENEAYMQPGAAVICDNWKPTMKGVSLRGGCEEWCHLPEATPIISAFEYISGNVHQMFVATATKVYNITTGVPNEIANSRDSGNYAAAHISNAAGEWLVVVNDGANNPMRYDGVTWTVMTETDITGPPLGVKLSYVWTYRNRLFFIEQNSMNAWCLGLNSIGGAAIMIPLSGAATHGGKLLFGATWSIDAGDGTDDKCVFMTDQGEAIIFTGGNPGDAANWRQEGRYTLSPPLGMNAHISIGGDLLIATIDGILPMSGAITKSRAELELASVTRTIKPMWREQARQKRHLPWTMCKWDEYGGVFTTFPGDPAGERKCLVTNAATGAHARFTGWDAMCWVKMGADMFFGTQDGRVMQADRTGYDDGKPYVAILVGGWELFQSPSQTVTWRQSRATFSARVGEPFMPQITAVADYVVALPPPPQAGEDLANATDFWDIGKWDEAIWDNMSLSSPIVVRNTGWVSIGVTGYTHAPVVQVTVAQRTRPDVDLISIAATFERSGVNV